MNKGLKYDEDKLMVSLLVPEFIEDVAKVMTMGAKKYGAENWKKGLSENRLISAIYRHLLAYHKGEKIDQESGCSHLSHIACNTMFLFWFDSKEKEK